MTALNPATNIPSNVNTVEKCLIWCASILAENNGSLNIVTAQGNAERRAQAFQFFFSNDPATNKENAVAICYVNIAPNWRSQGSLWKSVLELSSTAIPAPYTVA